jgi:hypothetical protein
MAHSHVTRPRASLPKQLANFTNSCGGLDLALRLIHALVLIASEVCIDDTTVKRCIIATAQLGLGEFS